LNGKSSVFRWIIIGEISDPGISISDLFNLLNLPQTVTFSNGNTIVYIYDAAGNKLRKVSTINNVVSTTEYIGGIEYDGTGSAPLTLAFVQTEEGRARWNGTAYVYEYDLKDHLGDTGVTVNTDATGALQVLQESSYYPFGATINTLQTLASNPANNYLYNHKELQQETGLYDYGARFYDPVIARWTTIDPLAEKGKRWSPYNYGKDNPIRNIDPDGMWAGDGNGGVETSDSQEIAAWYGAMTGRADVQKILNNNNTDKRLRVKVKSEKINVANQGGDPQYPRGAIGGPVPWYGNFLGPGPNGDPYHLRGYDGKLLKPIDLLDAAAQTHDYYYNLANTGGIRGALFSHGTADADEQLAKAA
jgi:RHS repeat-associated protein